MIFMKKKEGDVFRDTLSLSCVQRKYANGL